MADSETSSSSTQLCLSSYQTALCIVPPTRVRNEVDRLREHHDKAFGQWPPHINIFYPFVAVQSLPQATELIRAQLIKLHFQSGKKAPRLLLDKPGLFSHHHSTTVVVTDSDANGGASYLQRLRRAISGPFRLSEDNFRPHLTIGQSRASDSPSRDYLLGKTALLPGIDWPVKELVIMVRERTKGDHQQSVMREWGSIDISGSRITQFVYPTDFCRESQLEAELSDEREPSNKGSRIESTPPECTAPTQVSTEGNTTNAFSQVGTTYQFDERDSFWKPHRLSAEVLSSDITSLSALSISSFNVLVGRVYPPLPERCSILVRTILSRAALADVLVLQEVSDTFLSRLLGDLGIRRQYPFTTHAPSDQPDIGPLPSMRNIVVLSKQAFKWESIQFHRRHKGAVILTLDSVGRRNGSSIFSVVIAAVHLTCGLTDSSVAAKMSQLQSVVSHMARTYPENPWILAGDFNLTSSALTINEALKAKSISQQAVLTLSSIETLLLDAGLMDAWHIARVEGTASDLTSRPKGEIYDLYDGEEGATFNPLENPLALETVQTDLNRPQRYDRVLVREQGLLKVSEFSQFGLPEKHDDSHVDPEFVYGSDHWGIKASFRVQETNSDAQRESMKKSLPVAPELQKAPQSLSSVADLKVFLARHGMFPTEENSTGRNVALGLLKTVLQDTPNGNTLLVESSRSNVSVTVMPVGSYALGVWTASSDIDCLCVGNISSSTFFALALQKLRRAAHGGVRITRKVVATSGKMLELEVRGVRVELHYCSATKVAETWPDALGLAPTDPVFDLPIQSLTKLQPIRDVDYLQRTITDLASFRLAHRLIKLWAVKRGIYSSRFGYLGGIHITLLLSRICKLLYREARTVTAADIIATFFGHYAHFDWAKDMVYDPFFHSQKPKYYRTAREHIVILTLHRPLINVVRTASVPSMDTLVSELKRADCLLNTANPASWPELIGGEGEDTDSPLAPAKEFLASYPSFIRIDVQYWGVSTSKGATLLGWLESRCALLFVDLSRRLPGLHARIWPARFAQNQAHTKKTDTGDEAKEPHDYQACYFIGLAKATDGPPASDPKSAQSALHSAMNDFGEKIRGDEKHFDPKTTWIDVSLAKQAQVGDFVPDGRSWVGANFADGDDDDSEEEDEDEEDESQQPNATADGPLRARTKFRPMSSSTSTQQPRAKLRPASDVLHRLRWDPVLDPADYLVGYEDRFLGVRETPLAKWKTEQTDEEFIPQHRIVYFRRKSDGVKVWDRERRLDEMFGSGVGRATVG